jgi:hypothetical protein
MVNNEEVVRRAAESCHMFFSSLVCERFVIFFLHKKFVIFFFVCRLEVTTWRLEKLPSTVYASMRSAFVALRDADRIYNDLGFGGCDVRFRRFLAHNTGRRDSVDAELQSEFILTKKTTSLLNCCFL